MPPDEWARENRVYPNDADLPGERRPEVTPYTIPFVRAVHARTHRKVVMVISAQTGKTESLLDVIGERLDTSPVPTLYVGPSDKAIREQIEPRIMQLIAESKSLRRKVARGKRMTKTRKTIGGVPLRLASAQSSSDLKSDRFGLAVTDEADEVVANLNGQGDPIQLVDARGESYADFVHAVVSTPSTGPSEVEVDEDSGLEFWAETDPEDVQSVIWRLWLAGTRYHWAWSCPHCGEYFIPRFRCLSWDKPRDAKGNELPSTPKLAHRTAHLVCPRNGCVIEQAHRDEMNARGVYVAPGQTVDHDGVVHGLPPETMTVSFWVSGLASPFRTWGDRAAEYVEAVRSGNRNAIQTVINAKFGELWATGQGEVPEWHEVARLRNIGIPYKVGQVPDGVRVVTMTVDVQKNRLVFVVSGWGAGATMWVLDAGELYGDTSGEDVWDALAVQMEETYSGMPIRLTLIDSGFRPGKKEIVPEHRVYAFCRRFPRTVRATKGSSSVMRKPIVQTKIDVRIDGREFKSGLDLLRLDPDFFKSTVHEKVRWPEDAPGAWFLPSDISDDFCMQVVSEARLSTPNGRMKWVPRSRENHFLDCLAMQAAAAMVLNLRAIRDSQPVQAQHAIQRGPDDDDQQSHPPSIDRRPPDRRSRRRGGWLNTESIW